MSKKKQLQGLANMYYQEWQSVHETESWGWRKNLEKGGFLNVRTLINNKGFNPLSKIPKDDGNTRMTFENLNQKQSMLREVEIAEFLW